MKIGDLVKGKPGTPNAGIMGIVTSPPFPMLERYDHKIIAVEVRSFHRGKSWCSDCPTNFLEVVSEAR